MAKLTRKAQERAGAFVFEHARPLEQRLFSYHFQDGAAEDVLAELTDYQNPDGGFGRALEPDFRLPDSSAIATTVGLQILRKVKAGEDHPLVQGAIRYLLDTYDVERSAWPIIPGNADEAPHAPWWGYDDELPERWGGFLANPRAEIVGYLCDYSGLVPGDLLSDLVGETVSHLEGMPDKMEMHDLLCYIRLSETQALPEDVRTAIVRKLHRTVDCTVDRDPATWEKYGLKPLAVVDSPDSAFAPMLAREIDLNLDYEIEHQQEDGSWAPNWSWASTFLEAWEEAEREWKGVLTVKTLRALRSFGRLE